MELLIIKSNKDYLRFKEDGPLLVKMDKASVFPMDQIDRVKQYQSHLVQNGFKDVCIKKLVLQEEDL